MAERRIAEIRRCLANSSLHATPDWVQGCVEFFISEHHEGFTSNELQEFVLDQWKLADLREMGQGCLPPNINNLIKTNLPGKYALQVEWIKNVGQPAYTQLQNIRKQKNENVEVGANAPQTWEPRPTRMLQLMMCDGKQCIKGIEFRTINLLTENLLPGFKMLILGPVECRKGVVLLQEHNIQIIGGEIDSLTVPNAIENVLARTLNLEINPDPDPYRTQVDLPIDTQPLQQPQSSQIRHGTTQLLAGQYYDQTTRLGGRQDHGQTMQVAGRQNHGQTTPVGGRQNHGQTIQMRGESNLGHRENRNERNPEDDFLQEDDLMMGAEMDAHLSMLERQFQEEKKLAYNEQNDEYLDDLEQKYLGEIQAMESEPSNSKQSIPMQENDSSLLLDEDDDFLCQMPFEALEKKINEPKIQKNNVIESRLGFKQSNQNQTKSLPSSQSSRGNKCLMKVVKSQNQNSSNQSKITSFLNRSNEVIDSGINSLPSASTSSSISADNNFNLTDIKNVKKQQFSETTHIPKSSNNFESQIKKNDRHIPHTLSVHYEEKTSFLENSVKSNERKNVQTPIITDQNPFVYLSQIKSPVKCRKIYTVKAFVMTLLCRITFGKDGWQLRVTVCDGSSNLDVRLSSEVLERLIGFSAAEMHVTRQDMHKNPFLKDKVKNILQTAQQRLIHLNCLLIIEFLPGSEMPCVIDLEEIRECHLQALQARVDHIYENLI